jgi:hypothetical protein
VPVPFFHRLLVNDCLAGERVVEGARACRLGLLGVERRFLEPAVLLPADTLFVKRLRTGRLFGKLGRQGGKRSHIPDIHNALGSPVALLYAVQGHGLAVRG